MLESQINKIAEEIAIGSLIQYTKTEMLSPEEAEVFKNSVIENVKICLSGFSYTE